MKIALIGATGYVGAAILQEALNRGHEVTAIVRNPEKLPAQPKLHAQKGDVYNEEAVARFVTRHDAVINAFNPGWSNPDIYSCLLYTSDAADERSSVDLGGRRI